MNTGQGHKFWGTFLQTKKSVTRYCMLPGTVCNSMYKCIKLLTVIGFLCTKVTRKKNANFFDPPLSREWPKPFRKINYEKSRFNDDVTVANPSRGCSMIFEGLPNAPSTAHGARSAAATELRRSRCCDGVAAATEQRRPAPSRSFCVSRLDATR